MPQDINSLINYYKSYGYDDQTAQLYAILGVPIVGQFGENRLPSIPYMEMPRLQPEIVPTLKPTFTNLIGQNVISPFEPMGGAYDVGTAMGLGSRQAGVGPDLLTGPLQSGLLGMGKGLVAGAPLEYAMRGGVGQFGAGLAGGIGGMAGQTLTDLLGLSRAPAGGRGIAGGISTATGLPYEATRTGLGLLGSYGGTINPTIGVGLPAVDLAYNLATGQNVSRQLANAALGFLPGIVGNVPIVGQAVRGLMQEPLAAGIQSIGELLGLAETKLPEAFKTASWVSPQVRAQMSGTQLKQLQELGLAPQPYKEKVSLLEQLTGRGPQFGEFEVPQTVGQLQRQLGIAGIGTPEESLNAWAGYKSGLNPYGLALPFMDPGLAVTEMGVKVPGTITTLSELVDKVFGKKAEISEGTDRGEGGAGGGGPSAETVGSAESSVGGFESATDRDKDGYDTGPGGWW